MARRSWQAQDFGPLAAGLRLVPWTATLFLVAPIAGALVNRIGERSLIAGGLLLQAVGMAWVGPIAAPDRPYAEIIAPLIVAGVGVSMAMPATQSAVMGSVAAGEIGKASGAFSMQCELGGVFGIALLVTVFGGAGGDTPAQAFSDGFGPAIGVAAVLSLEGAAAGMGLPGRGGAVLVVRPA